MFAIAIKHGVAGNLIPQNILAVRGTPASLAQRWDAALSLGALLTIQRWMAFLCPSVAGFLCRAELQNTRTWHHKGGYRTHRGWNCCFESEMLNKVPAGCADHPTFDSSVGKVSCYSCGRGGYTNCPYPPKF